MSYARECRIESLAGGAGEAAGGVSADLADHGTAAEGLDCGEAFGNDVEGVGRLVAVVVQQVCVGEVDAVEEDQPRTNVRAAALQDYPFQNLAALPAIPACTTEDPALRRRFAPVLQGSLAR
ncbi:hypothetical protein STBA_12860 [Streptomyces sp. MP131-18]|nr:hypothetical protein STBA_12860 [Streptomyces sp. MP131-18]